MLRLKTGWIWQTGLLCLLRVLLDIIYFAVIVPNYAYMGFKDEKTIASAVVSWIVLFVSVPVYLHIASRARERASAFVTQALYLMSFIPFTACLQANQFSIVYAVYGVLYWSSFLTCEWFNLHTRLKQGRLSKRSQKSGDRILWIIGIAAFLVVVYVSGRYTGFRFHFNLLTVYDLRAEARKFALPTVVRYLFGWARAVIPFLFGYALVKKNRRMAVLFLICALLSFGVDGSKTALFYPIVIFGVVFVYTKFPRVDIGKCILAGFNGIGVAALCEYMLLGTYYLIGFIFRRLMFLLNVIASYYYDFFTFHTPDYFRASIFELIGIASPYPDLQGTIGALYFNTVVHSNCGLIADAVSNLGGLGPILMPPLLTALLHLLDHCTKNLHYGIVISAAIYTSVVLLNSFMSTALLSHGLLVILLILAVMKREKGTECEMLRHE